MNFECIKKNPITYHDVTYTIICKHGVELSHGFMSQSKYFVCSKTNLTVQTWFFFLSYAFIVRYYCDIKTHNAAHLPRIWLHSLSAPQKLLFPPPRRSTAYNNNKIETLRITSLAGSDLISSINITRNPEGSCTHPQSPS